MRNLIKFVNELKTGKILLIKERLVADKKYEQPSKMYKLPTYNFAQSTSIFLISNFILFEYSQEFFSISLKSSGVLDCTTYQRTHSLSNTAEKS